MTWLWRHKITIAVLLVVAGGITWFVRREPTIDATTKPGIATRGDLVQRVTISGAVTPTRTTSFNAPYDGYVHKIYVKVGAKVKAGDPIISMSQSPSAAGEEIFPMRAPFAGTVMQVLKTEGEYVAKFSGNNANAIVRIDDVSKLYVEADVPEIDYPKLTLGQNVVIKASAVPERSYNGRIDSIAKASKYQERWDRSRVEFPVVVPITDADDKLTPGMSVMIDVITKEVKDAVLLRHEFIQKEKDKYFVILEDGKRRDVDVGMQNEEAFEIKGGIAEGERVRQADFLAM